MRLNDQIVFLYTNPLTIVVGIHIFFLSKSSTQIDFHKDQFPPDQFEPSKNFVYYFYTVSLLNITYKNRHFYKIITFAPIITFVRCTYASRIEMITSWNFASPDSRKIQASLNLDFFFHSFS